ICDFDTLKKKQINELFPNTFYITEPSRIFNDKEVNLVVIASYDNYHYEQIIKSIENNKNIFVEKPFCLTSKEFNNINNKLKNAKISISSNLVLRTNSHFLNLQKKLKQFGKIYYLEGDYNYGRLIKITEGWRGKIPYYSVFLGGGIHLLDLIIWLKQKKVTEVYCSGNNISTKNTKFKHDDLTVAILKFEDGTLAKISSNFSSMTDHHHLLKVYGTKKSFFYDFDRNYFFNDRKKEKKIFSKNTFTNDQKSQVLLSFVKSLLYKKSKPFVNFIDIKNMMNISLAINKSLRTNKIVKLEN
ncbi:Gfo/Idh/MocA family oxidoreductase, partial [Candidatus Pelagibacter sp.]|nr:Gfo/Idh/MocA family oxidoreductase [Candidatus Pelagibacter sp.]